MKKKQRLTRTMMDRKMQKKFIFIFALVILAMIGLVGYLIHIEYINGAAYEKKVLSSLSYDSSIIPYQRGNIVDCNGSIMATSVPVYNVVLDCSVMTSDAEYVEPTIDALRKVFPDLEESKLKDYAENKKNNRYIVLEKKLPYEKIQPFIEMQDAVDEDGKAINTKIKGVWFEKEYQRYYPLGSLAASLIGFTSAGDVGTTGLENYYDDTLNGINGRQYGYLNSDSEFEKTVIEAKDGNNLVCSIDANIQAIVEDKIAAFNTAFKDNEREGNGSLNTGVLIMNPNTGEVLACAGYPTFDPNNPRDLSLAFTQEEIDSMSDDESMNALNKIWQNYCVTHTYEPGSVQKPFTVACGLETGTLTTDMTFLCDGYEIVGGHTIHCVNRNGHGIETLEGALADSCNDALMQMSYLIGPDNFLTYQNIFGFGLKTNIDLPGEPNTSTLVYNSDNITKVDLATNSFGQNYNCTMIEMITGFSSLINGGKLYQPYVVTKITDTDNNTISNIRPTLVKETVSKNTSDTVKKYLQTVVAEGSGKTAKVDGYSMGGKTGTAQKYDDATHLRKTGAYLVSFMGFVPVEEPQLVIYCVVDEPNVSDEAHSVYAQNIVREILKEVLPYLNIYPDEELSGVNEELGITGAVVTKYMEDHNGTLHDISGTEQNQSSAVVPIDDTLQDENPSDSVESEDVPQDLPADPSQDTPEDTPAETPQDSPETTPEQQPAE